MSGQTGTKVFHCDGRVLEVSVAADDGGGIVIDPAKADLATPIEGLAKAEYVAIRFAKFTDGRGYSFARRLREEAGYSGELRATGDVLLDQIPLMARCGFDSFEVSDAATIAALEEAGFAGIVQTYQRPRLRQAPGGSPWVGRSRSTSSEVQA